MASFCTKGWTYFEKFQDIMLNASVRGSHTLSAMHVVPPNALNQNIDVDGLEMMGVSEATPPLVSGSGVAADTSNNNNNNNNNNNISNLSMDIDIDEKSSLQSLPLVANSNSVPLLPLAPSHLLSLL